MPRLTEGNRSVAGRVAVITGAASGMGRAAAHLFADEGAAMSYCTGAVLVVDGGFTTKNN